MWLVLVTQSRYRNSSYYKHVQGGIPLGWIEVFLVHDPKFRVQCVGLGFDTAFLTFRTHIDVITGLEQASFGGVPIFLHFLVYNQFQEFMDI